MELCAHTIQSLGIRFHSLPLESFYSRVSSVLLSAWPKLPQLLSGPSHHPHYTVTQSAWVCHFHEPQTALEPEQEGVKRWVSWMNGKADGIYTEIIASQAFKLSSCTRNSIQTSYRNCHTRSDLWTRWFGILNETVVNTRSFKDK